MNFYIKKHDYYKLINKNNSFNESLKNRMDFLLDKYPNIELTQFYKKHNPGFRALPHNPGFMARAKASSP